MRIREKSPPLFPEGSKQEISSGRMARIRFYQTFLLFFFFFSGAECLKPVKWANSLSLSLSLSLSPTCFSYSSSLIFLLSPFRFRSPCKLNLDAGDASR